MAEVDDLIDELVRAPLAGARSLMRALGVGSQPTFSRLVARAGDRVLAVGRARARRYAATREVAGLGREIPLFRVEAGGTLSRMATLRPFAPSGVAVDPEALPRWMRGRRGDGVFGRLPPFLADLLPGGFAGRSFASRRPELGLPHDTGTWSDDEGLIALARAGEDGIGDLVPGEESARRLYDAWTSPPAAVLPADRVRRYPALAEAAIAGVVPGPCVGGEQPKFGVSIADGATTVCALVKFSSAEYSASARRWCDLIVCEHLALEALRADGLPAVASEILEGGSRIFLQTARFDRSGTRGRNPVVTLAAMGREYAQAAHAGWIDVAEALEREGFVLPATLARIRDLHAFGRFIANTDLGLDNLSLAPRDDGPLTLAPVYDMLPMGYAPVADELPARAYVAPMPDPGHEAPWRAAGERAQRYWRAVASDERISQPFRAIATVNADAVDRALTRFAQP